MPHAISEPRNNDAWLVNYDVRGAVHNYHFLQQLPARHPQLPRIWKSRDCAAIVVSTIPLVDIPEPHIMAWRDSFYEISLHELVAEVAQENIPVPLAEAGIPGHALALKNPAE